MVAGANEKLKIAKRIQVDVQEGCPDPQASSAEGSRCARIEA